MSCTRHFLAFQWERHDWNRRVTFTKHKSSRGTDMWSRTTPVDEVMCRTEYVCADCGAVRYSAYCACDEAVGEQCPARLAWLARNGGQGHDAHAEPLG